MTALDIQISVEEGDWPEEEALLAFCAPVLEAAAAYLAAEEKQPLPKTPPELSLVFTDDASMRAINAEWRNQDKPTNVLSFPAFPVTPGAMPGPMLGDIIVARETLERDMDRDLFLTPRQAVEYGLIDDVLVGPPAKEIVRPNGRHK